jgi:dihydrofolate synthase/folylpolyglutamate synthase
MTYQEALKYLQSFINYENISKWPYKESLKLQRIKDFLAKIDNPQRTLRCIHIAGTKGKGSTCAFVAYILKEAGYKVGLYTSPHLSDFRERIRILNPKSLSVPACPCLSLPVRQAGGRQAKSEFEGMILKDELADLVERLKPTIEQYNRNSRHGSLSFFEVYTSLAFVYFKEKKLDFAVLETGLGGRLDATNVVEPLVVAITPISYEHTQKLGNTLREIATEKAGIIKRQKGKRKRQNLIVVSAPQKKEVIEVIRNKCKEVNAKLFEVGKDILYQAINERFDVQGIFGEYRDLKIRLLGRHQLINAEVAVGIIEALKFYNINLDIDSIRNGLYHTLWPGRCEVISRNPLIVLDGAQNVASATVLKEAVRENFKYKKLILALGISNDKDVKGICNTLRALADKVVLTRADNPRAIEPKILAKYFNGKQVYATHSVKEAKTKVYNLATNREDLILVTGSLFVVGEFRNDKNCY